MGGNFFQFCLRNPKLLLSYIKGGNEGEDQVDGERGCDGKGMQKNIHSSKMRGIGKNDLFIVYF
jgi:hypothetical protein